MEYKGQNGQEMLGNPTWALILLHHIVCVCDFFAWELTLTPPYLSTALYVSKENIQKHKMK